MRKPPQTPLPFPDDDDDPEDAGLSDPAEDGTLVRRDAADTSAYAALRALPRSGTARLRVLHFIAACWPDGATDEQMQDRMPMGASTQRPRRVELVRGGWVCDSGRRRQTRTAADAIVWHLTGEGRRRLNGS